MIKSTQIKSDLRGFCYLYKLCTLYIIWNFDSSGFKDNYPV